jgi:integrase
MKTTFVSVIYDRKKRVNATGEGKVEFYIHFSRYEKKYVTIKTCNPIEWRKYQKSDELRLELATYHQVAQKMYDSGEEMTVANLNNHLGIAPSNPKRKEMEKRLSSKDGFITFMYDEIKKEKIAEGTKARKRVAIEAVLRFGRLSSFSQLTPENVKDFDDFLQHESSRTLVTINNYHKTLRMYTQMAYLLGYISSDPYKHPLCKFSRGTSKERRPLTEEELLILRKLKDLPEKLEKARDLFIFCAYTGLSYSDSQVFDFNTMTEKQDDLYFIDGKRIKTGNTFFTPILPPAMEILKKYEYKVPKLSNQKANDYLHDIEARLKFHKPLTMHVARHSFATLLIEYGVPMENIARMLGHTNIRTTQIYAHILHSTIHRHAAAVASMLR